MGFRFVLLNVMQNSLEFQQPAFLNRNPPVGFFATATTAAAALLFLQTTILQVRMLRIQLHQQHCIGKLSNNDEIETMFGTTRKRQRNDRGHARVSSAMSYRNGFGLSRNAILFASAVVVLLLIPENASAAWLSPQQYIGTQRNARLDSRNSREQATRIYGRTPRPQKKSETSQNKKNSDLVLEERIGDDCDDDLDSLRAHAAKLRREAESLESAMEQAKEAKIQKEIAKVDGWIDDLLIEVTLGDGTELLKTVDQVCDCLSAKRYSAHHVLKIFDRLCDVREQESRSNCSPLMELLVDATGKLDCIEKEDNPNKRWNHRVERVLRRKLFARDWNIEYVSDDEKNW